MLQASKEIQNPTENTHLTYMQQQSPEPQTVTKSDRLRRTLYMTFILVGEEMQDKSSRRSWACSYTVCGAGYVRRQ